MSITKYKSDNIQPRINKLIKLIDSELACIVRNSYGDLQAGHYYSVGAYPHLSLNTHNIHVQCKQSNFFDNDESGYIRGLINRYGEDYANYVLSLKSHTTKKYLLFELKEIAKKISSCEKYILGYMKNRKLTLQDRIILRNYVNQCIGEPTYLLI